MQARAHCHSGRYLKRSEARHSEEDGGRAEAVWSQDGNGSEAVWSQGGNGSSHCATETTPGKRLGSSEAPGGSGGKG